MQKKFIIDFGGSTLFPEKLDLKFLKKVQSFFDKQVKQKKKFIIICGGGFIARKYQNNISKLVKVSDTEKDWTGIYSTRLNSYFLKTILKKHSSPVLFDSRFKIKNFTKYPIIIGTGWQPGSSTDFVAVQIAVDFNIKDVIILGNNDYVYTADFKKYKDAKSLKEISWKDYLKIIPGKWKPGLHAPVDPVAALLAQKKKIKVIVAQGKDLNNFEKILNGEKFKGTIIH